jgi:hypothetical protein
LGANVAWHDDVDRVDIAIEGKYVSLTIGEKSALLNGEKIEFDTAAVVLQGRTFVPLRFVSEALGESVEWDGFSQYVYVGEKSFFTPTELGLKTESVETFRKYFGNKEFQDFFLHDIYGYSLKKNEPYTKVYVLDEQHLPIKLGETIIFDVWQEGKTIGVRSSTYVPQIYYLQEGFFPRDRDSIFGKDVRLADQSLEQRYAIVTPKDETLGIDENYKTFTLDKILYLGFLHTSDAIVLLKNPF